MRTFLQGFYLVTIPFKRNYRRIPEVVERLLGLYARERQAGESATEFFVRLETARVKDVLQDLEQLTAEDAVSADFIDLGEVSEFNPLVMEGECSA